MIKQSSDFKQFINGMQAALPTILGFISIGGAFGIIASSEGFSVWQVFLLSAVLYAGSAQFIIISMLLFHATLADIVFMVCLENFRMFLQSLHVAQYFEPQPMLSKLLMGSMITDESFGIFSLQLMAKKPMSMSWMHGLNIASWVAWWGASTGFAMLGKNILNPEKYGLDFALTAMFAGLWLLTAVSFFKNPNESRLKIIIGITVTTALFYLTETFFSAVIGVLVAAVFGSLILTYFKKETVHVS